MSLETILERILLRAPVEQERKDTLLMFSAESIHKGKDMNRGIETQRKKQFAENRRWNG